MQYNLNVVGQNIAKFRQQRDWTHKELAAKLRLLGCSITRQILANIEARRCVVTDAQIAFFAEVFSIPINDLFSLSRGREMEQRKSCLCSRQP
jgi:transcriptional regulator with XRE-family HTH domain